MTKRLGQFDAVRTEFSGLSFEPQSLQGAGSPNIYQSLRDNIAESALACGAQLEIVPAGHILLRQGDAAELLYALRRGVVWAVTECEYVVITRPILEKLFAHHQIRISLGFITSPQYMLGISPESLNRVWKRFAKESAKPR